MNLPTAWPRKERSISLITQIYEIQTPGEVEPLGEIGVDHIGSVILSAKDWRLPIIRETVRAIQEIGKTSSLIPLYNDPATVFRSLDYYRPDIVHFCEMLTFEKDGKALCHRLVTLQQEIRSRYPELRIMRSIPIGRSGENMAIPTIALAELFQPVSDLFLTDTVLSAGAALTDQPVDGFVGITGQTCRWQTARELVEFSHIPVILAGGLSPENVYEGVRTVNPVGVDSCTCTNRTDDHGRPIRFEKDLERVRRFVMEAQRAASDMAVSDAAQTSTDNG